MEDVVAGSVLRSGQRLDGESATFVAVVWTRQPDENHRGSPHIQSKVYRLVFSPVSLQLLHSVDHGIVKSAHTINSLRSSYHSSSLFEVLSITHYYAYFDGDFRMKSPVFHRLLIRAKKESHSFAAVDLDSRLEQIDYKIHNLILRCHLHRGLLMVLVCEVKDWSSKVRPTLSIRKYRIEKDCDLTLLATIKLDTVYHPFSFQKSDPQTLLYSGTAHLKPQATLRPIGSYIERGRLYSLCTQDENYKFNKTFHLYKHTFSK